MTRGPRLLIPIAYTFSSRPYGAPSIVVDDFPGLRPRSAQDCALG